MNIILNLRVQVTIDLFFLIFDFNNYNNNYHFARLNHYANSRELSSTYLAEFFNTETKVYHFNKNTNNEILYDSLRMKIGSNKTSDTQVFSSKILNLISDSNLTSLENNNNNKLNTNSTSLRELGGAFRLEKLNIQIQATKATLSDTYIHTSIMEEKKKNMKSVLKNICLVL